MSCHGVREREPRWLGNPKPWNEPGASTENHQTTDLTPLIREVTSHADWKLGNSLALFVSGVGKRVAKAYDGDKLSSAKLVIDADEGSRTASNSHGKAYRVRLFFGAPRNAGIKKCSFAVFLQDELAVANVELDPDAAPHTAIVRTIEEVKIADELRIRFSAREGEPVLSGIELICTEP